MSTARARLLLSTATAAKASPLLDRKIEETTANLPSSFTRQLLSVGTDNVETVVKYIAAIKSEINLSDNYRKDLIALLARFSKYHDNKSFSRFNKSRYCCIVKKKYIGQYLQSSSEGKSDVN